MKRNLLKKSVVLREGRKKGLMDALKIIKRMLNESVANEIEHNILGADAEWESINDMSVEELAEFLGGKKYWNIVETIAKKYARRISGVGFVHALLDANDYEITVFHKERGSAFSFKAKPVELAEAERELRPGINLEPVSVIVDGAFNKTVLGEGCLPLFEKVGAACMIDEVWELLVNDGIADYRYRDCNQKLFMALWLLLDEKAKGRGGKRGYGNLSQVVCPITSDKVWEGLWNIYKRQR